MRARTLSVRKSEGSGTGRDPGPYPGPTADRYRDDLPLPKTDEALVLEARAGARDAFEELVYRYGARLGAVLRRQVPDVHLVDDLVQEVWVRVYRALHGFRTNGRFRPWLFSIAFNLVRDVRRSRKWDEETASTEEDFRHPSAPGEYDPHGRVEEIAAIDEALGLVPEPFRTALHLVDVVGLTYQEAATSLACSLGTVKSRVNRGRLAFRDVYLKLSGDAPEPCPERGCSGGTS